MKFILGKKVNMTQVFDQAGNVQPVTVIQASGVVTQVKTKESDGYSAVQIGFGTKRESTVSKPVRGHTKELGNFARIGEFAVSDVSAYKRGDKIDLSTFKEGELVTISGTSKGKGFQGVVKRHGFKGGSRTHGQKHSEREPGAIGGAGRAGGRVAKGMRMAGRMGSDRVTVKNLTVIQVNPEANLILVKGAVPGVKGAFVEIIAE